MSVITADETREQYRVDEHGIITSPGKFEGEMIYVPYLWAYSSENPAVVEIDQEDRSLFPEIPADLETIVLFEDDQGFVSVVAENNDDPGDDFERGFDDFVDALEDDLARDETTIASDDEYRAGLARLDQIIDAEAGTPEGCELDALADDLLAYERRRRPGAQAASAA